MVELGQAPSLPQPSMHSLSSPQDLKPGNLAVNEDCELKVSGLQAQPRGGMGPPPGSPWKPLPEPPPLSKFLFYLSRAIDSGFWAGATCRRRDDWLRGDPLVPSPRGDPQLDALQPDRSVVNA